MLNDINTETRLFYGPWAIAPQWYICKSPMEIWMHFTQKWRLFDHQKSSQRLGPVFHLSFWIIMDNRPSENNTSSDSHFSLALTSSYAAVISNHTCDNFINICITYRTYTHCGSPVPRKSAVKYALCTVQSINKAIDSSMRIPVGAHVYQCLFRKLFRSSSFPCGAILTISLSDRS